MAEAQQKITLPQFFGKPDESFEDWAFQLRAYLRIQRLQDAITEEEPDVAINARVFDILVLHCKEAALHVLREVEESNGREAWLALNVAFAGKRTVRESALQCELFSRKWRADDTVTTFRQDIMRIRRSFVGMGERSMIPDRAIRNFIAAHLPRDKFGLVVQTILNDATVFDDDDEQPLLTEFL